MNGVLLMVVAAAVLACGYLGYGRWLANKWGVDKEALTPAKRMKDGKSFSPVSAFTAFSHQFSSICGAGPVTGTIVAMAFGWLPSCSGSSSAASSLAPSTTSAPCTLR